MTEDTTGVIVWERAYRELEREHASLKESYAWLESAEAERDETIAGFKKKLAEARNGLPIQKLEERIQEHLVKQKEANARIADLWTDRQRLMGVVNGLLGGRTRAELVYKEISAKIVAGN